MDLRIPPPELTVPVLGPIRDRTVLGPPEDLAPHERQWWYAMAGAVCERLGDPDGTVRHFGAALAELDDESDDRPDAEFRLGVALHSRFTAGGQSDDVDEAIRLFRGVLAVADQGTWPRLMAAAHLGRCLADRFTAAGDPADLTAATNVLEVELDVAGQPPRAGDDHDPEEVRTWISALDVLSECLREEAELGHDEGLLAMAEERAREALDLAGDDSGLRAAPEKGLARTLLARAMWTKSPTDLDEVIRLLAPSAPLAQAENPAARAVNLGIAHFERYRLLGDPGDLTQARTVLEEALPVLPRGSIARAGAQLNLAVVLRETAATAADGPALLDLAVELADEAADTAQPRSPLSVAATAAAAEARIARQAQGAGGGAEDLETACRRMEVMAPHLPPGGGMLAASFRDAWGSALVRAAGLTSSSAALDQGVALLRRALADPGGLPDRPRTAGNLAAGLYERFLARGSMDDLDDAIALWQEAVDSRRPGDPHGVMARSGLAVALHQRYDRRGTAADLDEAVERLTAAAALGTDPAERRAVLTNLGHAHQARYEITDDAQELARAVAAQREALSLRGPQAGSPVNARIGLALALGAQAERLGSIALAEEAADHAEAAHAEADAASRVWVSVVFVLAGLTRLRHALTAAPELLRRAEELYGRGYEAARERYPAAAAEGAMEWGQWQSRLERFPQAVAAFDLAEQAVGRLVAEQGQRAAKESWLRTSRGLPAAVAVAAWRAGDTAGAVGRLERTRALLMAERLRLGETAADATTDRLLSTGTVIYLVPGEETGVAFTVTDQAVKATALDGLGASALARWQHEGWGVADRLEPFARWAWEQVLGEVVPGPGTSFTLIAVGDLVHLPWQTACRESGTDRADRFLLDDHAVGFAPCLRVLPTHASHRTPRYLGVAVGRGTGLRELAFAEREVRACAARFSQSLLLVDEAATPERVLEWFGQGGGVAHFACHSETDPADPLSSALVLGGGARLTVRDLLDVRGGLDLVLLSACATSITGRDLPDEVVGLPGTLIGAGARGVVAADWPVNDLAACLLMTDFVGRWADGALPAEALRAAQTQLRDLRHGTLARRLRVLRGPSPAQAPPAAFPPAPARPFATLADWGAFTYTGHAGSGSPHVHLRRDRTGEHS
ncbi:CHAT domain-containing protein [Streptomyces lincolnensis]|uniref:CHAT domain-containing protein n=1 Tax=Streptomyces lincolnensis TaxID=1915 RepID=UPI001E459815|nr:CHAT domain-containing protein [Streptomyces lincolnensis]MCD7436724.1 CHAT domain-containing protein [Streptomyces lincolnensis]